MSNVIDLLEPIFFTPPNQRRGPLGVCGRILYKGGGGGGGQRDATEEERRLWAAQAASLEAINAAAMPALRTGMTNLGVLANESMDGSLANRLRNYALQDVNLGLNTQGRELMRSFTDLGYTYSPNRAADIALKWGLGAAAQRAAASNQANIAAEDTKWNRNAALTSLATGQGYQSISGLGSLANQISNQRNASAQLALQDQSNNIAGLVGLGTLGAYLWKKDGGIVDKQELRFANGGLTPYRPVTVPTNSPYSFINAGTAPKPDGGLAQTVSNIAIPAFGIINAAKGLEAIGIGKPMASLRNLGSATKDAIHSISNFFKPAAETAASTAAADAAASTAAAEAAASTAAAEAAASTAAAEAAGSAFFSALGAAAPWILGGYAVGALLDLWADGGYVKRKDFTAGGEVRGPGTSTSDSIPARLSDGEGVVNARAMNLQKDEVKSVVKDWLRNGDKAGDLVLAINDKGLEQRYGKDVAAINPNYANAEQTFSLGGLATIGHIARGFVPTALQIDKQRQDDELQNRRMRILEDAASREKQQFEQAQQEREQAKQVLSAFHDQFKSLFIDSMALNAGNLSASAFVDKYADAYNNFIPDNKKLVKLQDGNYALTENTASLPKAVLTPEQAASYLNSPQIQDAAYQQLFARLSAINPIYADKAYAAFNNAANRIRLQNRDMLEEEIRRGQLDVDRMRADTEKRYREDWARLQEMAIKNRGSAGLSTDIVDPVAYKAAVKKYNTLAAEYANNPTKELAQQLRLAQIEIANAAGKPVTNLSRGWLEGEQETPTVDDLMLQGLARKITKGDGTQEDVAAIKRIQTVQQLKKNFEIAAAHDRNAAVVDLIRQLSKIENNPDARQMFLSEVGVSPQEYAAAMKYIKTKPVAAPLPSSGDVDDSWRWYLP